MILPPGAGRWRRRGSGKPLPTARPTAKFQNIIRHLETAATDLAEVIGPLFTARVG
jgi:hypothetical protein